MPVAGGFGARGVLARGVAILVREDATSRPKRWLSEPDLRLGDALVRGRRRVRREKSLLRSAASQALVLASWETSCVCIAADASCPVRISRAFGVPALLVAPVFGMVAFAVAPCVAWWTWIGFRQ